MCQSQENHKTCNFKLSLTLLKRSNYDPKRKLCREPIRKGLFFSKVQQNSTVDYIKRSFIGTEEKKNPKSKVIGPLYATVLKPLYKVSWDSGWKTPDSPVRTITIIRE